MRPFTQAALRLFRGIQRTSALAERFLLVAANQVAGGCACRKNPGRR
jgi:hypothetical protein